MVGPQKAKQLEPVVLKQSHFRTPRQLRDCTFEREPITQRAFHRSDRIVLKGCAFAIVALVVILYFTRSL